MAWRRRPFARRAVAVLLLSAAGCAPRSAVTAHAQRAPAAECVQLLRDDPDLGTLSNAGTRNLSAATVKASPEIRRTTQHVIDAADAGNTPDKLCDLLRAEAVEGGALLTGYYRPVVQARRSRAEGFVHPLYALPPPDLRNHSRAEIDRGALAGKVPVVAWLDDPVEAFFIHIQGSAALDTPEGRMAVGYAGSNDRSYTSIGALLVARGAMRREDVTMQTLKEYLRRHPDERDAILHANERYIYFREVPDEAIGSLGVPLTDGRSLAADPEVYRPGTLLFIRPRTEAPGLTPRLAFVQDRGSAITGPARLDLYVGTGDEAARIAGPLQAIVDVFVLTPKSP